MSYQIIAPYLKCGTTYIIHVCIIFHGSVLCRFIILIMWSDFSIFVLIYSMCLLNVSPWSIYIPKYLYDSTTGIPLQFSFYSILLYMFFLLCISIPDFFLFIVIMFFQAQFSQVSIARSRWSSDIPVIARSSAYAKVLKPTAVRSCIRSLNITRKSVGESTPPYMTPLPIFISFSFTFIFVCS